MLDRERTALVVVDFQERLLPSIAGQQGLILRTARLIRGARLLQLPILVTEQYPQGLGHTDAQLIEALGDQYQPIVKTAMSCLGEQVFRDRFTALARPQILLCGIETHVCVYQTALDMRAAGYEVHLLTDCVSSRQERDHETALQRMAQLGCALSTHEMAIFEILRVSGTPEFKEWVRLIR